MSTSNRVTRIDRLEATWHSGNQCPTCHGYPRRLVLEDADSGNVLNETMPACGCPSCGRPVAFTRVYLLEGNAPRDQKGRVA